MRIRTAVGLVVIALAAPEIGAQETSGPLSMLASGDRVRLRIADGGDSLRASIESVTMDELVLRPSGGVQPLRLSLAQLQSLDVARGRRSQWQKGALIGGVPGVVVFGLASGVIACDPYATECDFQAGWAVVGGLIGGAATASVGALVGLAFKTDRWVRVHERKPKIGLSLVPSKGEVRAGLAVSF